MARKPLGFKFCSDFQIINDLRTQNYANPQVSSADQADSDGTDMSRATEMWQPPADVRHATGFRSQDSINETARSMPKMNLGRIVDDGHDAQLLSNY